MQDLQRGDVVVSVFPFAEGHGTKVRPAMVYAGPWAISGFSICWILMITSSARQHWPGDVEITDMPAAGLPGASLVRPLKIACIDTRNVLQKIGTLDQKTIRVVEKHIRVRMRQETR